MTSPKFTPYMRKYDFSFHDQTAAVNTTAEQLVCTKGEKNHLLGLKGLQALHYRFGPQKSHIGRTPLPSKHQVLKVHPPVKSAGGHHHDLTAFLSL